MSAMRQSSRLLIDEEPLQVLPSLAVAVGINEAVLLQQTHYWLKIAAKTNDPRKFHEERWWTFNSYEEWHDQMPWVQPRTIRALACKLERLGVLVSRRFNSAQRDQRKWYSIDYEKLDALLSPTDTPPTSEVSENDTLNLNSNVSENDASMRQKMTPLYIESTETSSESKDLSPSSANEGGEEPYESQGQRIAIERHKGRTSKGTIRGLTNEEAERLIDEAFRSQPLDLVTQMRKLLRIVANGNSSGEMRQTRAYHEFVEPFVEARKRQPYSDEDWRYGFEAALSRAIPKLGYVKSAAQSHYERRLSAGGGHGNGSGPERPSASPRAVVEALASYENEGRTDLRRFASLARRYDLTSGDDPPWQVLRELSSDRTEQQTLWNRLTSVAARVMLEKRRGGVA